MHLLYYFNKHIPSLFVSEFITFILLTGFPIGFKATDGGLGGLGRLKLDGPLGVGYLSPRRSKDVHDG